MTTERSSRRHLRDLWILGRRFAAFSVGSTSARFFPKMLTLGSSTKTLDRLGVTIDANALGAATPAKRKKLFEGLRREIADGAARLHGEAARPVFALAAITGGLEPFARARRHDLPHKLAAAQKPAAAFLTASDKLEEPVLSELEELRGWCEAIVSGFATTCDNYELGQLIDEAFWDGEPEAPEAGDEHAYNFQTAPIEHVVMMVALHQIICAMVATRFDPGQWMFRGDIRSGVHGYDDMSESHFFIAWNEAGILGVAFHKYSEGTDAGRWLGALPAALRPLFEMIPRERTWTSGFWITPDRRHRDGAEGEDGSNYFDELTSSPRVTLHERPNAWAERFELDEAKAELATTLAQRAMSGGGEITPDEIELMIEAGAGIEKNSAFALSEDKLRRAQASFAKLGLTFTPPTAALERERAPIRARAKKAVAAAMSPDEAALFEAARSNDAAAVRALLAKGVSPEIGTVADQFDGAKIPPGVPPLFVALHARATEAALALLDGGAPHDKAGRWGRPIWWAVQAQNIAVVRTLLERGAVVTTEREPLVATALGRNNVELARLLIAAGAKLRPGMAEHLLDALRRAGNKEAVALIEELLDDDDGD